MNDMTVTDRVVHNVVQGSDEWLAMRIHPASELPMAAGVHKNVSRGKYIRMAATGDSQEFSAWVQENIIDRGHEYEADGRVIAEEIIGDELFPVTVTATINGMPASASLDGRTMNGRIIWEHKSWGRELAEAVLRFNENGEPLHEQYTLQMDEQLVVSGADKCLFMVSDGARENMVWCWYTKSADAESRIFAIWKQTDEDVANYQHIESKPEPVGTAPESLPSLRIELTGMVTASNLAEFREAAMLVIGAVNTDLQTDQDFANAAKAVKWCGDVEERLEAKKQDALSQTASIDELFRTMDEIKDFARETRFKLNKLVQSRKDALRAEIVASGRDSFAAHIAKLNERIGKPYMPTMAPDFAAAIKGKSSFANMRDAVNAALANAKIAANEQADRIELNLRTLRENADGYQSLFHDTAQLVLKAQDDLAAIIKARIAEHKEAEELKLQKAREEAAVADRKRIEDENMRRQHEQEEAERRNNGKCDGNHGGPRCADPECWNDSAPVEYVAKKAAAVSASAKDDGRTIKIGEICALLGLTVTSEFLASLGFKPVGNERAAKLYRNSDFKAICDAIIRRIEKAAFDHEQ